ncbi:MAG: hypothetical protein Q9221_002250 [Calogaya cf. arnoldii]
MARSYLLWAVALSTALCAADKCPDTKPADPIPGCYGEPPCIYVRANFPGSQPACGEFDYCNCGGDKAVPLLPTTAAGGSSTWGCGAYTTVPPGPACPSSAAGTPGNGRMGFEVDQGGKQVPAKEGPPAVVTTGGPVSTAPNAFATDAPSTTTLSYDGGALIYTKNTFPDLTAIADPTTITTTVTKTRTDGPPVVYTGPVVVGAGGTWWGPPGTAPFCVYPFCTISGPPGAESNGADGGGSAVFGPPPGPPPTSGGSSTGNPPTPKEEGEKEEGEKEEDEKEDEKEEDEKEEDEKEEPDPPEEPQACPAPGPAIAKVRRSSSFQIFGRRLFNRQAPEAREQIKSSTNPLKEAFNKFGKDRSGNSLASKAIDGATDIILNKFPPENPHGYVTGLVGKVKLDKKLTVGEGNNQNIFEAGEEIRWQVRWDVEVEARDGGTPKGPHVNAEFGKKDNRSVFADVLDPKSYVPEGEGATQIFATMKPIALGMNKVTGYKRAYNQGKDVVDFESSGGKEAMIEKLKTEWKKIAEGPC